VLGRRSWARNLSRVRAAGAQGGGFALRTIGSGRVSSRVAAGCRALRLCGGRPVQEGGCFALMLLSPTHAKVARSFGQGGESPGQAMVTHLDDPRTARPWVECDGQRITSSAVCTFVSSPVSRWRTLPEYIHPAWAFATPMSL
jgi:hypothetical protein